MTSSMSCNQTSLYAIVSVRFFRILWIFLYSIFVLLFFTHVLGVLNFYVYFSHGHFSSGVFPPWGGGMWRHFCLSSLLFPGLILTEEFWLELKILWETCRKVVKLVAFTRGLVWGVMARSLGTPDERMCEYFGPFVYFILIFLHL